MTSQFFLLLPSAPIFQAEYYRTENNVFRLPQQLQTLVKLVNNFPSPEVDGVLASKVSSDSGRIQYQKKGCRSCCGIREKCQCDNNVAS